MAARAEVEPIPGPEAFEEHGRAAEMSQAAFVLGIGAGVGGQADLVPQHESMALPDLAPLVRRRRMRMDSAVARLPMDVDEHVEHPELRIPADDNARLVRRLVDRPDALMAASLVEASLHNPSMLVRTASAVAALDTTGPRPDLVAHLAEGARSRDELTRDLARVGLARVDPAHEALRHLVGRPAALTRRTELSNTAVLTHGTFSSRTTWWRPGGDYYDYLDGLVPPLHLHDPSFRWSGLYSSGARELAANQLVTWIADQNLDKPDFFGHSHGATVGNLATQRGLQLDRLVLLSWPVHAAWLPDLANVTRVIDVRVRFDLVVIADRGGQRYPTGDARVSTHVHGWFDHGLTHDPGYWDTHSLPEVL